MFDCGHEPLSSLLPGRRQVSRSPPVTECSPRPYSTHCIPLRKKNTRGWSYRLQRNTEKLLPPPERDTGHHRSSKLAVNNVSCVQANFGRYRSTRRAGHLMSRAARSWTHPGSTCCLRNWDNKVRYEILRFRSSSADSLVARRAKLNETQQNST